MTDPLFLNQVWVKLLREILLVGRHVSPRGRLVREIDQKTIVIDMNFPVLTILDRKLNYKFMVAEAAWILSGSNELAELSEVNKNMAKFSDDGKILHGAYGPPFVEQLHYVTSTLQNDNDTRQATMTFWKRSPGPSKDIPCTVAIDFKLRDGKLNCHVFMRSSDAWLGIPYDVFSFTMMACAVLDRLNLDHKQLGTLFLTAASSHLYEEHWDSAAFTIWQNAGVDDPEPFPIPKAYYDGRVRDPDIWSTVWMLRCLQNRREMRWWEK